jgi:DNA-binding NarL/FixJ family response regulator
MGVLRQASAYGLLLASSAFALQWFEYRQFVHDYSRELYVVLVAAAFLALGIYVGARAFRSRPIAPDFQGNPQAQAALGISARELAVLEALAAGHSNKEIARRLELSPNTVKTHVAQLFQKLGARRRTQAIHRARELNIVR